MSLTTSAHWMYNPGGGFYDHEIDGSLRFNDNDSAHLTKTFASDGTRTTYTFSCWLKRGNINTSQVIFASGLITGTIYYTRLEISTSNKMAFLVYNDALQGWMHSANLLRDVGAWYHLVWVFDTTNGTASDRMRMYINGERVTNFATEIVSTTYPSLNGVSGIMNSSYTHKIGRTEDGQGSANYLDGYLADVNFIDGTALEPTSFGETKSGIWIPKEYSGSYGTNGFHLEFAGNANDTSGNGNNFTSFNIAASDYVLDTPTNNFAVLNNLDNISTSYSEGNLKISQSSYNYNSRGSFGLTSGKYYWEVRMDSTHGEFGVCENGKMPQVDPQTVYPAYFIYNNGSVGVIYNNATSTSSSSATMTNWSANDIAMIAYDADNGNLYHGLNGVWQNSADPAAGTGAIITGITTQFGGELVPFFGSGTSSARNWIVNFGQDSTFAGATTAGGNSDANGYGDFKYAPPSGYLSLCSANLPSGAIDTLNDETPTDYFDTMLYTAATTNGTFTHGNLSFRPDFSWIKNRNNIERHFLIDVVRGNTSITDKYLVSNSTVAEGANNTSGTTFSVTDTGYQFIETSINSDELYFNGRTYVGWNWKAGGTGVSNTDGSIASTVSVGATSQQNWFSIVGYTGNATAGATVGHGLNTQPDMIITKGRGAVSNWFVYHSANTSQPETDYLTLETTNATTDNSTVWNDTAPTSSVFSIGQSGWNNTSGINYIAYCFANAEGMCKVGSYTGNGSTDGPFIYTGFRPAFVMVKASTASNWFIWDVQRNTYNVATTPLFANSSFAEEATLYPIDFLSNGFKLRASSGLGTNESTSYIYLAIAEQPFKYANAR
jgi:hypothetical protein